MRCAKTAESIEMPFEKLNHVDPMNHALDGGQGRTKHFAAAKTMLRLAKLLAPHPGLSSDHPSRFSVMLSDIARGYHCVEKQ